MPLLPPYSPYASIFAWAHQIPLVLLGKVHFLLGGGGGGIWPGYFKIFWRKKSWPSPFLEWINESPSEIPKQNHLTLPLPIQDKNNRK